MGFTQYSNTWQRSAGALIPPRLVLLLQAIHSHSSHYRLTNAQLAQEIGCTERNIKYLLAKAKALGLIEISGLPRSFRGYTRTMSLTSSCLNWIKTGAIPLHLKSGVKEFNRGEIPSPTRGEILCPSIEEKKQENKESKQAREGALPAPFSGEERFQLPVNPVQIPKPPNKPAIERSSLNASEGRGETSKPRGEPVIGLPEPCAHKQAYADDLWRAIDSANLGLRSTIRLYALAQEKQCTASQFKALLDKALHRKPWNLGGLLHTMLSEDAEIYVRQAEQQQRQMSRDALDANLRVLCEWISNAPSCFKNGEAVRDKGRYILTSGRVIDYSGTNQNFASVMHQLEAEADHMRRQAR